MNIIICGAGDVGSHAAHVLTTKGHAVTVVDIDASRLTAIEDSMDVATFTGNCAEADVLAEAGARGASLVVAATESDEVNLISASVAKQLGAAKTIARVHHIAFFEERGFDYLGHFGVDRFICPEYSTALAIARTLRNPGALAIEAFARGRIEMQEFPVSRNAPAIGRPLSELRIPAGSRLAAITRKGGTMIPEASSQIEEGDIVVLVGNTTAFHEARRLFHDDRSGRRRVVMLGGTPMAVWLCGALRDRDFRVRLFEQNRRRAQQVAEQLDWVTVLNADPTDSNIFEDEKIDQSDWFIAILDDDEENILSCLWAKRMGVPQVVAVVQRQSYLDLLKDVGIDRPFSPKLVAVREIENVLDESNLRHMASLAEGVIDVFRVRVTEGAEVLGKPLREIRLSPNWLIAAIQHDQDVRVPMADDTITDGDVLLVIGRHGREKQLRKVFDVR